jgi:hypothetical protein
MIKLIEGKMYVVSPLDYKINDRVRAIVNSEAIHGSIMKMTVLGDTLLYKVAGDDGNYYYLTERSLIRL